MKYIAAAPPRLHCSTCDETYDLPVKTNIKLYKELKCPLDDFELLVCSTGDSNASETKRIYVYSAIIRKVRKALQAVGNLRKSQK